MLAFFDLSSHENILQLEISHQILLVLIPKCLPHLSSSYLRWQTLRLHLQDFTPRPFWPSYNQSYAPSVSSPHWRCWHCISPLASQFSWLTTVLGHHGLRDSYHCLHISCVLSPRCAGYDVPAIFSTHNVLNMLQCLPTPARKHTPSPWHALAPYLEVKILVSTATFASEG